MGAEQFKIMQMIKRIIEIKIEHRFNKKHQRIDCVEPHNAFSKLSQRARLKFGAKNSIIKSYLF